MKFYILIIPSLYHWMPRAPCATSAKPTVEPTMLWVAETGNLSNVAAISQTQEPYNKTHMHTRASSFPEKQIQHKKRNIELKSYKMTCFIHVQRII